MESLGECLRTEIFYFGGGFDTCFAASSYSSGKRISGYSGLYDELATSFFLVVFFSFAFLNDELMRDLVQVTYKICGAKEEEYLIAKSMERKEGTRSGFLNPANVDLSLQVLARKTFKEC